jgi:vesicle coat complex subunit
LQIFNHLINAAKTSANARIRESVLRFFTLAVDHLSALGVIPFGYFLPVVIELLNDRAAEVREAAVSALETMYLLI